MKENKAILVIDVQQALCVGKYATYKAKDIISNINKLTTKARQSGVPIIFIQHQTQDGLFMKGEAGWQLAELLEYNSSDFIVAKSSSDAFSNTDLKSHLESLNINHLVICGMQSEFCVDSTIRRALALNYAVTAVSDAHTTLDNEVISAATISMHHNCTWENITSYSVSAKLMATNNIHFK